MKNITKTKIKLIALGALCITLITLSLKYIFNDNLNEGRYAYLPILFLLLSVMFFEEELQNFKDIKNNP